MYKIIGADAREYGPLSADEIRRWISEGRLTSQSQAQLEGTSNWVALGAIPEFAEALARPRGPGLGIPPGANPQLAVQEILGRSANVDVGSCLSRAWDLFVADFWIFVAFNALTWVLLAAANSAAVGILLNGPIVAGLLVYMLKRMRGEAGTVTDLFAGFTGPFVHLLLISLITGVLILVGLILCVIPGVYLMVAWAFAMPLALDRRLAFWDAMELSRKVAHQHFGPLLGLFFVTLLLNIAGILAFGVGVFVTMPVTFLAWLYAYEDLCGRPSP